MSAKYDKEPFLYTTMKLNTKGKESFSAGVYTEANLSGGLTKGVSDR